MCDAAAGSVHAALDGDYQPALDYASRFRAFEDRPWNVGTIYRALATHFPDARFVLTLRQPERWWGSVERWLSVSKPGKRDEYCRHLRVDPALANAGVEALQAPMLARYREYNDAVIQHFEGTQRLLVVDFEAGDGWPELSAFFGTPPPDVPFPMANRQHYDARDHRIRAETLFKKARRRLSRWGLRR